MHKPLTIAQVRLSVANNLTKHYSRAQLVMTLGKMGKPITADDIERSNRALAFRLAWVMLPREAHHRVQLDSTL